VGRGHDATSIGPRPRNDRYFAGGSIFGSGEPGVLVVGSVSLGAGRPYVGCPHAPTASDGENQQDRAAHVPSMAAGPD